MIKIIKFSKKLLNKTWIWLKDSEIKALTMTPDFSKRQQLKWFKELKNNKKYFVKGIEYNKERIGVVGLKNINNCEAEYFGYIGEKKYWGLGIGKEMLKYIENYCRKNKLKKIYLKVLKGNKRAFLLYQSFGYIIVKEENLIYIMKKNLRR